MGMQDHFAPLTLWTFVSQVPRALPWAFTFCAFGTEHNARDPRRVNSTVVVTSATLASKQHDQTIHTGQAAVDRKDLL